MAVNCGPEFGICAVRITLLDDVGNVADVADNSYVTNKPLRVRKSPDVEQGQRLNVRSGCDCSVAKYKGLDLFNWFTFQFAWIALEPIMQAMLIGAETIEDGADVVGLAYPQALDCDEVQQLVAFEFWTKHRRGSGADPLHAYVHHVYPASYWQVGDTEHANAFADQIVNGFSVTNSLWGGGPYGDGPPDGQDISEGGYWKTNDAPPAADCVAADVEPSS